MGHPMDTRQQVNRARKSRSDPVQGAGSYRRCFGLESLLTVAD
jgi:hypothetical protein